MSKIKSNFLCKRCGDSSPENFYTSNGAKTKCKKCHTNECHQNTRSLKDRAIEYLGSKCMDCGIENLSPWAFDFHHRDPTQKDFSWGNYRTTNWEKIKKEIDKCDLLCANCHRTRHHQIWIDSLDEDHPYFDNRKGSGR